MLASVSSTYTEVMTAVFSETIAAKAWLATGAAVFALVQVTTAARIFGKLENVIRLPHEMVKRIPLVGAARVPADAARDLPLRLHPRLPDNEREGDGALHRGFVRLRRVRGEGLLRARPSAPALDAATRRRDAVLRTGDPVADVGVLVLHGRPLRLLRQRGGSRCEAGGGSPWDARGGSPCEGRGYTASPRGRSSVG